MGSDGAAAVPAIPATHSGAVLDLAPAPVRTRPFDHVVVDGFIAPPLYDELARSFPPCPPDSGAVGAMLYWGDPAYDALMTGNAAWQALRAALESQDFVDYCRSLFRVAFGACTIDIDSAAHVAYREPRADKSRRRIEQPAHAPHELFVRTGLHQGRLGYVRAPHIDHRRRLMTMLIYFCDGGADDTAGGDLVLHGDRKHWWQLSRSGNRTVRPRPNRMAAFPCQGRSFHSVTEVVRQDAPRNFLQILLSSTHDVWPG